MVCLMMRKRSIITLFAPALAALAACNAPSAPDLPARTSPIAIVSFYANNCTECHVRDARNFATEPYTFMEDDELRSLVRKQAFQEANIRLDPAHADAMSAYFKAMIAGEPFVVVNETAPGMLAGEATREGTVTLRWPTEQVVASRPRGGPALAWRATIPAGLRLADAEIQVRVGTTTTRLKPTVASHSHAVTPSSAPSNSPPSVAQ